MTLYIFNCKLMCSNQLHITAHLGIILKGVNHFTVTTARINTTNPCVQLYFFFSLHKNHSISPKQFATKSFWLMNFWALKLRPGKSLYKIIVLTEGRKTDKKFKPPAFMHISCTVWVTCTWPAGIEQWNNYMNVYSVKQLETLLWTNYLHMWQIIWITHLQEWQKRLVEILMFCLA